MIRTNGNMSSTRVQYERHGVKGNSPTGFYLFIAGLVASIIGLATFFINYL